MKRTAFAGLFLCVAVFAAHSPKVGAQTPTDVLEGSASSVVDRLDVLEHVQQQVIKSQQLPEAETQVEHTIVAGETLAAVAETYQTTWQRLYAKNLQLSDPNVINPGEILQIPDASEELKDRALPVQPKSEPVATRPKQTTSRGSVAGNSYTAGYCTWYAKNRRMDLPNNLGNADTWVARAAAQGIPTGSTPRVGAIGQRGMHVVYVEAVNGDGTVTVSEMNHYQLFEITTRTVTASYFKYIY